jgi:hypothetical protein
LNNYFFWKCIDFAKLCVSPRKNITILNHTKTCLIKFWKKLIEKIYKFECLLDVFNIPYYYQKNEDKKNYIMKTKGALWK